MALKQLIPLSFSPVTGASISIMVFSDLRSAAPSLMIFKAALSSIRPSRMKCCFNTSGLGLLVRGSNTSEMVSLLEGGKGTPANVGENTRGEKSRHVFRNKGSMKISHVLPAPEQVGAQSGFFGNKPLNPMSTHPLCSR